MNSNNNSLLLQMSMNSNCAQSERCFSSCYSIISQQRSISENERYISNRNISHISSLPLITNTIMPSNIQSDRSISLKK
jgi:hypothetical protein